ncbi:hypothetical protein MAR_015048 [Mya arenaria]|uniref:Uncharacterized protein n=1 Tax=Mya arenaria TaxID=6604 RepID=A0ABY7FIB9_MYAAR|nr:uncharacterized protein LOC128210329 [Mya arenaria]WAR21074.1 hypothetical protein MAR_015048 [Mya arenaria]
MAGKRLHTNLSSTVSLEPQDNGISPVGSRSRNIIELELADMNPPGSPGTRTGKFAYDETETKIGELSGSHDKDAHGNRNKRKAKSTSSQPVFVISFPNKPSTQVNIGAASSGKVSMQQQNEDEPRQSTAASMVSNLSSDVEIPLPNDSRMSQLSEITHTSLTPEGPYEEEVDFYCVDHGLLVTGKSVVEAEHVGCQHVLPAHEWAEAQAMEKERTNTEARLRQFDMFAGRMIDERDDLKHQLSNDKEEVSNQFLDVMEDVIAFLLSKQKQFMRQLDELHNKHIKQIDGQIKRCQKIQEETSDSLKILEASDPISDEFKVLKRKLQMKCPVYEEILRRDFNMAMRIDYEFRQDPWVEQLFNNLSSIGDVIARPRPSQLPGFLSFSKIADYSKKNVANMSTCEATSAADENSCCFTGSCFIPGGRIILADWNNACLKLFNNKGVLTHRLDLPNNPWDVKLLPENRVVVTVPGEQTVLMVEHSLDKGMEIVDSFHTKCECWAVTPIEGGRLAMTCDPWSKQPYVNVYNLNGKLLSFYKKDSNDNALFSYPEHITTDHHEQVLYISDSRKGCVVALTLSGCLLFRYSHKNLMSPVGITSDYQGNIYICGKESHNVHQVSKSGELIRILFDKVISSPRTICLEPEGERIVVTGVGNDNCNDFVIATLE